jgi:hypothetical protein
MMTRQLSATARQPIEKFVAEFSRLSMATRGLNINHKASRPLMPRRGTTRLLLGVTRRSAPGAQSLGPGSGGLGRTMRLYPQETQSVRKITVGDHLFLGIAGLGLAPVVSCATGPYISAVEALWFVPWAVSFV